VEEAKIGQQHAQREKVEENPEIEQWDSWQCKNSMVVAF
jgi:hypothetical protein